MNDIAMFCSTVLRHFGRMLRDERAATAIEYALIAAGVSVAIAATVYSLGTSVRDNFYQKISDAFN